MFKLRGKLFCILELTFCQLIVTRFSNRKPLLLANYKQSNQTIVECRNRTAVSLWHYSVVHREMKQISKRCFFSIVSYY